MDNALDNPLDRPAPGHTGKPHGSAGRQHVATGFEALDAALPGGGLPLGGLAEIRPGQAGVEALHALLPALARLSRSGRWIALIAPPQWPHLPTLASYGVDLARVLVIHPRDRSRALPMAERALRNGNCAAVLAWPRRMDSRSLRRLRRAAEEGGTLGLLCRQAGTGANAPAMLHLGTASGDSFTVRLPAGRSGAPTMLMRQSRPPVPAPSAGGDADLSFAGTPRARSGRNARRRTSQLDLPLAPRPHPHANPPGAAPSGPKGGRSLRRR